MKFAVVINAKAGMASRMGVAPLRALMQEKLGTQLASLRVIKPSALASALEEAVATKPDAVLVLGGDGTARSAAAQLYPTRIPGAYLPGGTMNILPKRLYGDMALEDVLGAIAEGKGVVTELETGLANKEPFFVAAFFGFLPLLAYAREQHRSADSALHSVRVAGRLLRFGHRLFQPHVRFKLKNGPPRLSAALIVSLGSADVLHPMRAPDSALDSFECVSLDVENWWSLAGLTANALLRPSWRDDPRVAPFRSTAITVHGGGRVRATLDGEPLNLPGPLELSVAKSGLRALAVPRPAKS